MSYQSTQAPPPFRRTPTKSPVRSSFESVSSNTPLDFSLPSFHSEKPQLPPKAPRSKRFLVVLATAALCCFMYILAMSAPEKTSSDALAALKSKVSQSTEALKQLIPAQPFVWSEPTPDFHTYAIAYLPLNKNSKCRRQSQIASDFASLEASGRVEAIRLFSTDCKVIPAYLDYLRNRDTKKRSVDSALKLVLGIEPSAVETTSDTDSEATSLELLTKSVDAQLMDIIDSLDESPAATEAFLRQLDLVVLGSEGLANQNYHPKELVEILAHIRQRLDTLSSDIRIPVTTSEPLGIWDVLTPKERRDNVQEMLRKDGVHSITADDIEGPTGLFCDSVDVIGLSVSPFSNPTVDAAHAGAEVEESAYLASLLCNKPVLALEVGWPSAGSDNGNAKAGKDEQLQAVSSVTSAIERISGKPLRSVLYQYFDDEWLGEEEDFARHYGLKRLF
ncbi:putative beta-glucosidase btgE [Yarrowia sp. B02]|nr:putative beta-glucosidase btgE [Yarrowia sp. B02]